MAMRQVFRKLLKNIIPTMYTSGMLFVYCTPIDKSNENKKLKLEPPDVKKLTHEYMIKQSVLDAANSATQALTITYMAITYLSIEYRILLNQLISLYEETIMHNVNDAHWDLIVEIRNEMQDKKEKIVEFSGYMDYVHKMAINASELSYLCGLDNLTSTLQQRIEDALNKVKAETDSNTELERAYLLLQEQCVKGSKKTIEE